MSTRRSAARRPLGGFVLDLDDFPRSVSPHVAAALVRLVTRAEAMGLVEAMGEINSSRIVETLHALEAVGIGTAIVDQAQVSTDPRRAVQILLDAVEASPVPRSTFRRLAELLGVETIAGLVGVSEASARRYLNGERETPDAIAFRLHTVAMIVADLAGAYNSYGIRRWFSRPRARLGARPPAQVLSGRWEPDDEDVRAVRALAAALTAPSEARALREDGHEGLVAPSASLLPGGGSGYRVDDGLVDGPSREGQTLVLFGARPDLDGWLVAAEARPAVALLDRVRHLDA